MSKWKAAEIVNAPESYVDFVERVSQVSDVLKDSGDRTSRYFWRYHRESSSKLFGFE